MSHSKKNRYLRFILKAVYANSNKTYYWKLKSHETLSDRERKETLSISYSTHNYNTKI